MKVIRFLFLLLGSHSFTAFAASYTPLRLNETDASLYPCSPPQCQPDQRFSTTFSDHSPFDDNSKEYWVTNLNQLTVGLTEEDSRDIDGLSETGDEFVVIIKSPGLISLTTHTAPSLKKSEQEMFGFREL